MNQSSYVYPAQLSGLGRIPTTSDLIRDRIRASTGGTRTTRTPTGGSSTTTRTRSRGDGDARDRTPAPDNTPLVHLQPDPAKPAPETGSSHPVVTDSKGTDDLVDDSATEHAPFFQVKGDRYVINGRYELTKNQALMYGGGLAGALILLKLL